MNARDGLARVTLNEFETRRFGIFFGHLEATGNLQNVEDAIRKADRSNVAVLSSRVDTADLVLVRALEDLGFRIMDTLVYYRRALPFTCEARGKNADLPIIDLDETHAEACAAIAQVSFRDYLGHYHADPHLSNEAADAAYADWAARLVREPAASSILLGTRVGEDVIGFMIGIAREENSSEIVLNAVHPDAQRQGHYGALLECYLKKATARGDRSVMISTQLQNYPVQRAWSRTGFTLFKSFHTLHRWSPVP